MQVHKTPPTEWPPIVQFDAGAFFINLTANQQAANVESMKANLFPATTPLSTHET
jgi:hypothetical protein